MLYHVYIIFSEKTNKYYIGTTDDIERRIEEHNNIKYTDSFTSIGIPWKLAFNIICQSSSQAYKIEKHIKAMHSRIYIENLIKHPEMTVKLLDKYKD
jgi:putative endonuclease